MAHDVFISYSTKDKSVADAACHALEARGVRCWIAPRDIPYGSDWSEQIIQALDESEALVLVFSSSANESRQVMRELSYAADRGLPVLPLRIEDVLPSKGFRYYLGVVHWLDALSPPLEAHLERLSDRVSALLAADQAPGPRDRKTPPSPPEAEEGSGPGTEPGNEATGDRGARGATAPHDQAPPTERMSDHPLPPRTLPTESAYGDQSPPERASAAPLEGPLQDRGSSTPRSGLAEQVPRTTSPDSDRRERRRRRPRWIVLGVPIAVLALVGILAVVLLGRNPLVPNLVGQTEAAAERLAEDDFEIKVSGTKVGDEEKGAILSQDPKPGERAEQGSTISVVMSAGQPPDPGDIFEDDFSTTFGDWPRDAANEDGHDISDYANGGYRIFNPRRSGTSWASPTGPGTQDIEDAIMEVDATKTGGQPDSSSWGVVCRLAPDSSDYYLMGISSDGRSFIARSDGGTSGALLAEGRHSGAIQGPETNHIRGDCVGNTLTLYLNDQKLLEANDAKYSSGSVGLYVGNETDDPPSTDVIFDNFVVSSP